MSNASLEPTRVNGREYYTVAQFARIVGRDRSQIYMLYNKGNKLRKLDGIKVGGATLISVEEVEAFPFDSRKV